MLSCVDSDTSNRLRRAKSAPTVARTHKIVSENCQSQYSAPNQAKVAAVRAFDKYHQCGPSKPYRKWQSEGAHFARYRTNPNLRHSGSNAKSRKLELHRTDRKRDRDGDQAPQQGTTTGDSSINIRHDNSTSHTGGSIRSVGGASLESTRRRRITRWQLLNERPLMESNPSSEQKYSEKEGRIAGELKHAHDNSHAASSHPEDAHNAHELFQKSSVDANIQNSQETTPFPSSYTGSLGSNVFQRISAILKKSPRVVNVTEGLEKYVDKGSAAFKRRKSGYSIVKRKHSNACGPEHRDLCPHIPTQQVQAQHAHHFGSTNLASQSSACVVECTDSSATRRQGLVQSATEYDCAPTPPPHTVFAPDIFPISSTDWAALPELDGTASRVTSWADSSGHNTAQRGFCESRQTSLAKSCGQDLTNMKPNLDSQRVYSALLKKIKSSNGSLRHAIMRKAKDVANGKPETIKLVDSHETSHRLTDRLSPMNDRRESSNVRSDIYSPSVYSEHSFRSQAEVVEEEKETFDKRLNPPGMATISPTRCFAAKIINSETSSGKVPESFLNTSREWREWASHRVGSFELSENGSSKVQFQDTIRISNTNADITGSSEDSKSRREDYYEMPSLSTIMPSSETRANALNVKSAIIGGSEAYHYLETPVRTMTDRHCNEEKAEQCSNILVRKQSRNSTSTAALKKYASGVSQPYLPRSKRRMLFAPPSPMSDHFLDGLRIGPYSQARLEQTNGLSLPASLVAHSERNAENESPSRGKKLADQWLRNRRSLTVRTGSSEDSSTRFL